MSAASSASGTPTVPRKLRAGDAIRVVAPSRSLAIIGDADRATRDARFAELGLTVTFGAYVDERDDVDSTSIEHRVADLHSAFLDPEVAGILTVIGGFNSNQLLPHLDFDLIRAHPKVFCGFSDITALGNAMLARAALVTYSGPHWSTFGMRQHFDRTMQWFRDCVFADPPMELCAAPTWSDDAWFLDQDNRRVEPNAGWQVLQPGSAEGRLVGGNLCTFNLLLGTPYQPALEGSVLLVEDDLESAPHHVDRNLQSLLQQPAAQGIRALLIGRFQRASGMTPELLAKIVAAAPNLAGRPVIAGLDFGHTDPLLTLPIGGSVEVSAEQSGGARVRVTRH